MTAFNQKRFSVSMALSEKGRDNWDKCFGPKASAAPSLPDPLAPRTVTDESQPMVIGHRGVSVRRDDLLEAITFAEKYISPEIAERLYRALEESR